MSLYKSSSLVMIPTAYKDGKLYSVRPTDGSGDFTFSRGSNLAATRVASSGYIEKGRENLLLQSNQFDTTWVKANTTLTSGQVGYDGSSDAWLLTKTAASGNIYQGKSYSGVNTFSIYAKGNTTDWIRLRNTGGYVYFDVTNGVVGGNISAISPSITSVGGGWYRCEVAWNGTGTITQVFVADSDGSTSGTSGSVYIQDAQLESSLVATSVISTGASTAQAGILEDMPRLDYSGGASCPALLLEPQRTNQVENSEYYESYVFSRASTSSNATASPEGLLNASELVEDSTNENHFFRIPNLSWTSGTDVVFSIYLKENTRRYARLRFDATGGNTRVWLDLRTGETTFIDNTDNPVCTSTDVGNGWFRYEFKVTPSNTSAAGSVQIFTQSVESVTGSLQTTYQGDGTSGIYVWGAQVETASYPTSYIPTYGSSVTRSSDKPISSSYNYQAENILGANVGTIILDCETIGTNTGSNDFHMFGAANNIQNGYLFRANSGTTMDILERNSNASTAQWSSIGNKQTRNKIGVSYSGADVDVYVNGVAKSLSSGTPQGGGNINGFATSESNSAGLIIHQILLFPNKLTDSEMASITTL